MSKKTRILSMDGGGILCLLSLLLIERIEKARPGFLQQTEIFAGTSSGGINALIMASLKNPADALPTCLNLWGGGVNLSSTSPTREIAALTGWRALVDAAPLEEYLQGLFGDTLLGDLPHRVVVAAFQLLGIVNRQRSWKPKIFHNFGERNSDPDHDELVADLCLRTTAFPLIYPAFQGYVDGGLFANDPAMCAVVQHVHACSGDENKDPFAELRNTLVFSLGTGQNALYVSEADADWGYGQWLLDPKHPMRLLDMVTNGPMMAVNYQCRALLGVERYLRLNPSLDEPVPSVQSRSTTFQERLREKLTAIAMRTNLDPTLKWIDESGWMETDTPPARKRSTTAAGVAT